MLAQKQISNDTTNFITLKHYPHWLDAGRRVDFITTLFDLILINLGVGLSQVHITLLPKIDTDSTPKPSI